jgi:small neutral amino acid transporter SnatA (MarC family)
VITATAMAIGVSLADLVSTGLGSGGHRFLGATGLGVLRTVLALALVVIGLAFVWRGLTGTL